MSILGAILASGASMAASQLMKNDWDLTQRERNMRQQKELMNYQQKLNSDFLRQSPLLKVQGLRSAGISPLSEQGSFATAGVSSIPSVLSSETAATPSLGESASALSQMKTADAQAKLADAQAENLNADTELKLTESQYKPLILQASLDFQKLVNDQEEIKKNIASRTQDAEIQKAIDSARLVGDQADLVEIDLALRKVDQKYYDKQKANELLIQLQTLDNLRKDGKIKDKQVGLLAAQTVAAYASAAESRSAADYNRSLKKQVDELTPVIRKKYNNEAAVAFQTYGKVQAEKGLIQWENKVKSHLDPETESYMRRWSQVLGGGAEATGMVRDGAITYGMTKPTPKPQPVKGFKK